MDKIELRKVKDLKPHKFNVKYFLDPAADPNFQAIRESIAREGIQEPLIIKSDGTILSGNLRYAGLLWALAEKFQGSGNSRNLVNDSLVPVRVHEDFASEADEVLYLIRSNIERRHFTPERVASIWDMWRSEYETVVKRGPGRPRADAPKIETPKEVAAQLGVTVKTADALVVVKNSRIVPESIKTKVYNSKLQASLVAKAVAFAEEEAEREQREPTQADVVRYLDNPPPKKLADAIHEAASTPVVPKPAAKPDPKPVEPTPKPAVVKATPVVVPKPPPVIEPPPVVEPEPTFEDILIQAGEEPDPIDDEPPEVSDEPILEAADEPSPEVEPDPPPANQPGVIDLHTEYPISELKIDPTEREAWKEHFQLEPKNYADKSGTFADKSGTFAEVPEIPIEDKIADNYLLIGQRVEAARAIIESVLGDLPLTEAITSDLVGLHSSLDTFLKNIGAIPSSSGIPVEIKDQLSLCKSLVGGLEEVDDPVGVRDLLLEVIQEAKFSSDRLTNSQRSLIRNGLFCPVCFEPQYVTVHGEVCGNGHGGLAGITQAQVLQDNVKVEPIESDPAESIDFDQIDVGGPTAPKLAESDLDDFAASILSSSVAPPKKDPVVDILEEFSDELGSLV